ncbi:UDP-N-acetylglucosamine--N-acetylmuramyl-(pentape ptide) pyrophosphoryl-UDP N-acetylglucosamine transferase [Vallitalea longa]|uniref:UDP-N-acetylglucosamine--N-acetylmuramyl-(Pentape ptide) pyrophosphoryl-UDP N-acetylglucosamine transferase n=1 Tax=Vallitalea longa TaxID=2936439 RepID=A0A9W5Y7Y4_9FIRM|nr:glycosyltransferase [Vallitalea longa]GKX28377.1 UDP-N-acetylglucosamine--N-acetylmuramyl-(pentape ptide) pyrophosphoryl-UDP N-acetylglucosamine transferase [Vallitalea longa]
MQNKCEILILTADFGSGHKSVSKAIKNYITDVDSSITIQIVDMYKIIRPKLYKYIYKFFKMLIKYALPIYNFDYYKKNNNDNFGKLHSCFRSSSKRLARYLEDVQPSIIISTFPTCSAYVAKYKKDNNEDIPLITCITDIVKGSEWINYECDMYFVATDSVRDSIIKRGINKDSVITTGIPIRRQFFESKNNVRLKKQYGIDNNDFVILMMGGGLGLIPKEVSFYKWIASNKRIKLYIITGKNKKLYDKISKYDSYDNINILKYTDKVADIMSVSDLLITKPGGITLFETISSSLPFIIYKPVLGQELENCKYVKEKGLGYVVNTEEELVDKISIIMDDENLKNKMIENIDVQKKNIDMKSLAENIITIYSRN